MPVDSVGNNLSTANSLKITSIKTISSEWVGKSDPNDYYTFNLSGRSSFNLALNDLSANADVQLLDKNGTVVTGSYSDSRNSESISTTLETGNYYIRVYQVGCANTSYKLSVSGNEAPQLLQFGTDKSSYQVGETVKLTNATVFDGNGVSDLAQVDFRLQKDGGNWDIISNVKQFSADSNINRASFNYSLSNLTAGKYQLWGKSYDQSGATSNTYQTSFSILQPTPVVAKEIGDWFDQNIQDTGMRAATRLRFADNVLDRNDIISILREAKDNSVVDATEVKDLRTLVSNASYLKIPEYVRVLTNKVVNGDVANQKYQSNTLGNLDAGSSDVQLENLISKWFYGSDRPTTPYTYQYTSGSLFQNGISYQDIKQGVINDCFLLAGLAETAFRSPSTIENMFIDNGDNTFTVRFWQNGVADYVTVDRYLPTTDTGYLAYANKGSYYNNSTNELWVTLAEKAYAQINESGWIYQDNTNSYKGISHGGYTSDAFSQITGRNVSSFNALDFNSIVNAFNSGQLIGLATLGTGVASNIVPDHAYVLVGYNSSTQKFTLFNPWGIDNGSLKPGILELAWNEIASNFSYWDYTKTIST
ncbi:C2 family cysteine protease [[Scytonema hofmanni] UTEX B 1581]|uniref:C2 family cysteine protease n=1 Tax=[Scytonema hofmanni] UTEX B 1581 TaxID=379535 RepID=UPI000498481F|nr:C2 family cysteine protease [[Scytonema hofmanni] UTEX B 1581]